MRLTNNPLARIRLAAGFTNAQAAADKLGCSRLHVLSVERGRVGASYELVEKMARLYKTEIRTLDRAIRTAQKRLLKRKLAEMAG